MSLLLQYSMCSNNSLYTQRLHCWNWSPEPEGYSSCTISTKYYRYYQVRNNKVFDSFKRLSFPVILSSFTSYLAVLAALIETAAPTFETYWLVAPGYILPPALLTLFPTVFAWLPAGLFACCCKSWRGSSPCVPLELDVLLC